MARKSGKVTIRLLASLAIAFPGCPSKQPELEKKDKDEEQAAVPPGQTASTQPTTTHHSGFWGGFWLGNMFGGRSSVLGFRSGGSTTSPGVGGTGGAAGLVGSKGAGGTSMSGVSRGGFGSTGSGHAVAS